MIKVFWSIFLNSSLPCRFGLHLPIVLPEPCWHPGGRLSCDNLGWSSLLGSTTGQGPSCHSGTVSIAPGTAQTACSLGLKHTEKSVIRSTCKPLGRNPPLAHKGRPLIFILTWRSTFAMTHRDLVTVWVCFFFKFLNINHLLIYEKNYLRLNPEKMLQFQAR